MFQTLPSCILGPTIVHEGATVQKLILASYPNNSPTRPSIATGLLERMSLSINIILHVLKGGKNRSFHFPSFPFTKESVEKAKEAMEHIKKRASQLKLEFTIRSPLGRLNWLSRRRRRSRSSLVLFNDQERKRQILISSVFFWNLFHFDYACKTARVSFFSGE